jgi:hypothetical protein
MAKPKRKIDYRRVARFTTALDSVFSQADSRQYAEGFKWYDDANAELRLIALQHDSFIEIAAAICAALSPKLRWSANLLYTDWVFQGLTIPHLKTPVNKALAILESGNVDLITAPKTSAFYRNLIGDLNRVTIDVWMYRAAGLNDDDVKPWHYRELELAVKRLANHYKVEPARIQAIIWIVIREAWKRV